MRLAMKFVAGEELYWAADYFRGADCLVFDDVTYTYDDIDSRSNCYGNVLLAMGCSTGERVGLLLHNSVESLECLFGVIKSGAAFIAMNARNSISEHRQIFADGCPKVVFSSEAFRDVINPLAEEFPEIKFVGIGWSDRNVISYGTLAASTSSERPYIEVKNSDIGRLHYTSGSTGLPKGVVMSNEVLRERLFSFFATYEPEFSVNDTMLHVAPLTHAAGIWVIPCYMRGVKSIVLPHFDLDVLISSIEQYQVTQMMLVPTMMTRFVAAAERGNYNLSSLKVINYGTAPVPAETLVRGIRCLGKIFRQFYGMTECPQPIAIFRSTDHDIETKQGLRRLVSCGKLAFNTSVVIRDENGQPVLEGEVGEITLKLQRQAATSYWRDPEMTALMQRDGWFYSGDLGRIDQEGYFYIVGRTKDMIISGGFNIYTREIENVLYSHPAVFEACVFGTPDPEWGETVTAAVIRKEGIQVTEKDLVDFCKNKIASFKKPRILYFVEELPKNHAGKFNKLKIRESFLAKNRFNVVIT